MMKIFKCRRGSNTLEWALIAGCLVCGAAVVSAPVTQAVTNVFEHVSVALQASATSGCVHNPDSNIDSVYCK
jgi:hypothetical protein